MIGQVYLDGYYVGTTEDLSRAMDVTSGRHSIEIRADGYQPAQDELAVAAGRSVTYRSALTRAPEPRPRATSRGIRRAEDVLCDTRLLCRRHPPRGEYGARRVRPAARYRGAALTPRSLTPAVERCTRMPFPPSRCCAAPASKVDTVTPHDRISPSTKRFASASMHRAYQEAGGLRLTLCAWCSHHG